jgi:hypothetical protein
MLHTLNELEKSNDETYLKLEEDFFVFPSEDNCSERFDLRMKSNQRFDDIVMSHRYVMAIYNSNKEQYSPVYEKFNQHHSNMFDEVPEDKKHLVRMSFPNYNWKEEQEQVKTIANESLIINLWVTIEQFTTRTLNIIDTDSKSSYRWDIIKTKFSELNIDIESIKSYEIINELRVVNNKIKHLYCVDEQLAKFENFKDSKGKSLNSINFNLQSYISASYHFVFTLINLIGKNIYYPK